MTIHHRLQLDTGAPGVTCRLAQEYRTKGHEVLLYSFDQLPSFLPSKIHPLVFPYFVAKRIKRELRRNTLDVIDASSGDAWLWGSIHRRASRPLLLITRSHGLEHAAHQQLIQDACEGRIKLSWKYPLYHGGLRLWEVAQSLRVADGAFLLNKEDRRYASEQLNVFYERSIVVRNGLSEVILAAPMAAPPMTDSQVSIAIIGSYIPGKGVQYAASALNALLPRYPDVRVTLLGTGRSAGVVTADYAAEVRSRIQVVPSYRNEQLPQLLRGHQIHLFPSLTEGFGIALLEAMALGLAPITTAVPGPLGIIRNGHNGLLVRPRDPNQIEAALETLLLDRRLLDYMRSNARSSVQSYGWSQVAAEQLELYRQLIAQRPL
jgi:glycosyltransferase involved in cell wall biosynthesis